jgi:hypothetical protein
MSYDPEFHIWYSAQGKEHSKWLDTAKREDMMHLDSWMAHKAYLLSKQVKDLEAKTAALVEAQKSANRLATVLSEKELALNKCQVEAVGLRIQINTLKGELASYEADDYNRQQESK